VTLISILLENEAMVVKSLMTLDRLLLHPVVQALFAGPGIYLRMPGIGRSSFSI